MPRYRFQESKVYQTTTLDKHRPVREVIATSEEGARGRLPKAGYGRCWITLETPVESIGVPVFFGDERTVSIGYAKIHTSGEVDLHVGRALRLDGIADLFPKAEGIAITINLTYL